MCEVSCFFPSFRLGLFYCDTKIMMPVTLYFLIGVGIFNSCPRAENSVKGPKWNVFTGALKKRHVHVFDVSHNYWLFYSALCQLARTCTSSGFITNATATAAASAHYNYCSTNNNSVRRDIYFSNRPACILETLTERALDNCKQVLKWLLPHSP